jgi:hypothetical protein
MHIVHTFVRTSECLITGKLKQEREVALQFGVQDRVACAPVPAPPNSQICPLAGRWIGFRGFYI